MCHAAFTHNGELYIFAGLNQDSNQMFNDLWKFNPGTFCWKKVEPKGKQPSQRCGMTGCVVGDVVVLFGGIDGDEQRYIDVTRGDRPCDELLLLELSPSLKALCKLAVIQYHLDQSQLPQDVRWELRVVTTSLDQSAANSVGKTQI